MDVKNSKAVNSPHTNKPITSRQEAPIFWCEVCKLKLVSPTSAIQHMCGRPHKSKLAKRPIQNNAPKRKGVAIPDPMVKKSKNEQSKSNESNFKCIDCNIMFGTAQNAKWHFEGKRHAEVMAKKTAIAKSLTQLGNKKNPMSKAPDLASLGIKQTLFVKGSVKTVASTTTTNVIPKDIGGEVIIAGSKNPTSETKAMIPGGKTNWKNYFVNATETKDVNIKSFDSKEPNSLVEPSDNKSYMYEHSKIEPSEVNNDYNSIQNNNLYNNCLPPNYGPLLPVNPPGGIQYGFYGNYSSSNYEVPQHRSKDQLIESSNNIPDPVNVVYNKMRPSNGDVQDNTSVPTSEVLKDHPLSSNNHCSSVSPQKSLYSSEPQRYVSNNVHSRRDDIPNNNNDNTSYNMPQNEHGNDKSSTYQNYPSYRTPPYSSEQPYTYSPSQAKSSYGSPLDKYFYSREGEYYSNRSVSSQYDEPRNEYRDERSYSQQSSDYSLQSKGYRASSYTTAREDTNTSPLKSFYGNSLERFYHAPEKEPEDSYSYSPPSNYRTLEYQTNDRKSNNFVNSPRDTFGANAQTKMHYNEPRNEYDDDSRKDSRYRTSQYYTDYPGLRTTEDSYVKPLNNFPNDADGLQRNMQYNEHRNTYSSTRDNDNTLPLNYGTQQKYDYSSYQKYFTPPVIESKTDIDHEHVYDKNYWAPPNN